MLTTVKLTIAGALAVLAASAQAAPLAVRERSADVSEATIIVDAPPRQVYELATDYARWPHLFSDIRSVVVEGGTRERARVRFRSQAIDREVTVQFDNIPDRVIRFTAVPSSRVGRAGGEYVLTPVDGGRRTQLTARLFLKVVGPAKLVVSTQQTRAMRHQKLRADLTDTQRWAARPPRAVEPRGVKHASPRGGSGPFALAAHEVTSGEALTMRELPGNITEGVVIVNAPPSVVYAHATDYANWERQFSDIRAVKWESGDRDHARVRFRSIAFDRSITVQFDNVPGRLIRFRAVKAPPGARARGEYTLFPLDGGTRTKVVARLYMDLVGPSRMLFSDKTIRTMRHSKLEVDLRDTERWFDALADG